MTGNQISGFSFGDGLPFCLKCNSCVDSIQVEEPIVDVEFLNGPPKHMYTGKRIVTIRCHGEKETFVDYREPHFGAK